MATPGTYLSSILLNLGQTPGIDPAKDEELYDELIDIHNAIEQLAVAFTALQSTPQINPLAMRNLASKYGKRGGPISGDTWWTGNGGMLFGCMAIVSELIVPIADTNRHEIKNAGNDGWTGGLSNGVVFPTGGDEHYLTVPKAGVYATVWSLSVHVAAGGGNSELHAGVRLADTDLTGAGEAHRTIANLNDSGAMCNNRVVDCPLGTEQISMWVSNNNSQNVHCEHGGLIVTLIGGT